MFIHKLLIENDVLSIIVHRRIHYYNFLNFALLHKLGGHKINYPNSDNIRTMQQYELLVK